MGNQAHKRPTNITLDAGLLAEAKSYDINISRAAENGLKQAVTKAKAEKWKRDNAAALESSNRWVEANGLPLDRFRQF